jgi:hypothetical protein
MVPRQHGQTQEIAARVETTHDLQVSLPGVYEQVHQSTRQFETASDQEGTFRRWSRRRGIGLSAKQEEEAKLMREACKICKGGTGVGSRFAGRQQHIASQRRVRVVLQETKGARILRRSSRADLGFFLEYGLQTSTHEAHGRLTFLAWAIM